MPRALTVLNAGVCPPGQICDDLGDDKAVRAALQTLRRSGGAFRVLLLEDNPGVEAWCQTHQTPYLASTSRWPPLSQSDRHPGHAAIAVELLQLLGPALPQECAPCLVARPEGRARRSR